MDLLIDDVANNRAAQHLLPVACRQASISQSVVTQRPLRPPLTSGPKQVMTERLHKHQDACLLGEGGRCHLSSVRPQAAQIIAPHIAGPC